MTKILLWILVLCNELVRRSHFLHAVNILLAGTLIQTAVAYLQYVKGAQLGLEFLGETSQELSKLLDDTSLKGGAAVRRVSGLLGHSNLLGAHLALLLPMGMALLMSPIGALRKTIYAVIVSLGTVAVVLTLSRGAWVGLSVAICSVLTLTFAHKQARARFFLARVAIISVVFVAIIAFSGPIIERLFKSDPMSVDARLDLLIVAQRMVIEKPVFGFGLNQFVFVQTPYTKYPSYRQMHRHFGDQENWPVVHNVWALTWVEQGTVGFILFVTLHIMVLSMAIRNLRIRDPVMHALNVGLVSGFVAMMLDGLVSFYVRQLPGIMFWIVVGLMFAIDYWRRVNEAGEPLVEQVIAGPQPAARVGGRRRWLPAPSTGFTMIGHSRPRTSGGASQPESGD